MQYYQPGHEISMKTGHGVNMSLKKTENGWQFTYRGINGKELTSNVDDKTAAKILDSQKVDVDADLKNKGVNVPTQQTEQPIAQQTEQPIAQ